MRATFLFARVQIESPGESQGRRGIMTRRCFLRKRLIDNRSARRNYIYASSLARSWNFREFRHGIRVIPNTSLSLSLALSLSLSLSLYTSDSERSREARCDSLTRRTSHRDNIEFCLAGLYSVYLLSAPPRLITQENIVKISWRLPPNSSSRRSPSSYFSFIFNFTGISNKSRR